MAPQTKKGDQLASMTPVLEKTFDILGDDIVEFSTENESLKNKIGSYDKKWLEESKAQLLKQIAVERKTKLNKSRKEKQMKKTVFNGLYQLSVFMEK